MVYPLIYPELYEEFPGLSYCLLSNRALYWFTAVGSETIFYSNKCYSDWLLSRSYCYIWLHFASSDMNKESGLNPTPSHQISYIIWFLYTFLLWFIFYKWFNTGLALDYQPPVTLYWKEWREDCWMISRLTSGQSSDFPAISVTTRLLKCAQDHNIQLECAIHQSQIKKFT